MDVTYSLDTLTMHSTSVLLLASAFTVVVAFAVAETNNEHVPGTISSPILTTSLMSSINMKYEKAY